MPNLQEISNGLNWKVYHKKEISPMGIEFETEDKFIELTYERFKKDWELVAEIKVDLEKKKKHIGIESMGSFLFMITNNNPYGTWAKKFPEELDDNARSAWELQLKNSNPRDTSVGDILQDLDSNLFFMVMGIGFKQVRIRNKIDSDSVRPQTKKYQDFPKGFGDANKMWKSVLRKSYPDLVGVPVYGMDNRGAYRQMAHAIYIHVADGKYEVIKDFENWASSMSPMKHPNQMDSKELRVFENQLKANRHMFDSYKGTKVYSNAFQGGDEDAIYD